MNGGLQVSRRSAWHASSEIDVVKCVFVLRVGGGRESPSRVKSSLMKAASKALASAVEICECPARSIAGQDEAILGTEL